MTNKTVVYKYGTGNQVNPNGSSDVRDGIDNLQSFDVFMNADEDTYNQRDGNIVKTVNGMNNEFNSMIQSQDIEFSQHISGMAFTRSGTFFVGGTLYDTREVLLWDVANGGDGHEYGWTGAFPKVVPPSSTPASTGGVGAGAWVDRSDVTLRSDLAATGGAGIIGDTLQPGTSVEFAGGADKTGALDSSAAFGAINAGAYAGVGIYLPKGDYLSAGELYELESDCMWFSREFNSGVSFPKEARGTALLITIGNKEEPVRDSKYNRSGINLTAKGRGAQHIDCIRATLHNSSTDGQGNTAIYAHAASDTDAMWSAALHGETRHGGGTSIAVNAEAASFTTSGGFYGIVVHNTTPADTELHPVTGLPAVSHPTPTGIYVNGYTTNGDRGQWLRGLHFSPESIRIGGAAIRDDSIADKGYWSIAGSSKAVADILLEGSAGYALICNGSYSSGNAIRVKTGIGIAYDNSGAIKTKYDSGILRWGLYSGATELVGFGTTLGSAGVYLSGTRVLAAQRTGWGSPTGTATRTAFDTASVTLPQLAERLKALIDDLKAHGMIGA